MKNSIVSIITPSYKSEQFIAHTIESAISQTFSDWEMIIVDDMSPDRSNEIIQRYSKVDRRIKLIKLKENSGPANARNIAIKEARGRYIAFLDADDLWVPDKLKKQLDLMREKDCALSYSAYNTIDENGRSLNRVITPPLLLTYSDMLKSNRIGCLTAIYDTEKVGKMYMPDIKKRQDYGLWLRVLKKSEFAFGTDEILASYRISRNSVSRNKVNLIKYNYLLFRKHERFSILKSFYYVMYNIYSKILKRGLK